MHNRNMRPHLQNYLQQAQNDVHQNMLSASGERYLGADGWVDQELMFTNDLNPGSFFGADGGGAAMAASNVADPGTGMPASQPYILQVSNASAANATVTFWQASTYLGNFSNWSNGSYTQNGVTISSAIGPTVNTYYNVLNQSNTNPFTVGKTYLQAISGSNAQVTQPLQLVTYDANGNFSGKTIVSPLPPTQFQAGVYINPTPYRIDQYTGVSMTVLASAVFQIYFYPSFTINLARGLGDQNIGRSYGNRPINQPTVAIVK